MRVFAQVFVLIAMQLFTSAYAVEPPFVLVDRDSSLVLRAGEFQRVPAGPFDPPREMHIACGAPRTEVMSRNQMLARLSGDAVIRGRIRSLRGECYYKVDGQFKFLENVMHASVDVLDDYTGTCRRKNVKIQLSRVSDPQCLVWKNQSGPVFVEVGAEYIFSCNIPEDENFLLSSALRIFCVESGVITRCREEDRFSFDSTVEDIREHFLAIRLETQFSESTLVVVVEILENGGGSDFQQVAIRKIIRNEGLEIGEVISIRIPVGRYGDPARLRSGQKFLVCLVSGGENKYQPYLGIDSIFNLEFDRQYLGVDGVVGRIQDHVNAIAVGE